MTAPNEQYHTMTGYLAKLYGDIYEYGGIRHPLRVYRTPAHQAAEPDSILGPRPQSHLTADSFAFYNQAYLHTMQNSQRNLFNGTTFAMTRVQPEPMRLDAALGKYFDMIATCAALEHELRDSAASGFFRLPSRSQLHREIPPERAMTSGHGRSAAIGGAALLVFNHGGTYKLMLSRRSSRSATDPGFYHVIPAFIFQPSEAYHPQEWSIRYQVEREYLEELFNMPEESHPASPDYFQSHPAYRDLQAMTARGDAALYLTGIAMNLLTLRAEFCALLLIHDPDWYARATAPGSPHAIDTTAESDDGRLLLAPVESNEALLAALPPHPYTVMPPQATAALWLGVEMARQIIR